MAFEQDTRASIGEEGPDASVTTERGFVGRLPWPVFSISYVLFEIGAIFALTVTINAIYFRLFVGQPPPESDVQLGALVALLVVGASILQGAYAPGALMASGGRMQRLVLATGFGFATLLTLFFVTKSSVDFSRFVTIISFAACLIMLGLSRMAASHLLRHLAQRGRLAVETVMVIGTRPCMSDFVREHRERGHPAALVAMAELPGWPDDPDMEGALARGMVTARRCRPDSIVICLPWTNRSGIESATTLLSELPPAVYLASDPHLRELSMRPRTATDASLGLLLIGRPLTRGQTLAKRSLDIFGALAGIIVLAPLYLAIAVAIKLDSRGPVVFRQARYGFNREPFTVFKFRSMADGSERGEYRQATRNDPRVTRLGRLLRRTNLDELPQLVNVLMGTMSLVGPRPHPLAYDDKYAPIIGNYSRRYNMRPGMTGWAQVNGHRGETPTTDKMEARLAHDLYYLARWSFWLDIKILLRTLTSLASYRNAV